MLAKSRETSSELVARLAHCWFPPPHPLIRCRSPSGSCPEAREDVLSSSERSHLFFINFFVTFLSGHLTNSMATVVLDEKHYSC
jgi:hypothetical protein